MWWQAATQAALAVVCAILGLPRQCSTGSLANKQDIAAKAFA